MQKIEKNNLKQMQNDLHATTYRVVHMEYGCTVLLLRDANHFTVAILVVLGKGCGNSC